MRLSYSRSRSRSPVRVRARSRSRSRSPYARERYSRDQSRERERSRSRDRHVRTRDRSRDRYSHDRFRDRSRDRYSRDRSRDRYSRERRPRERRAIERGTEEQRATSTTLFVGNVPYAFLMRDVEELMERSGRVRHVTLPMDRVTGRNRGYCFVEFDERRDAEDAISKFQDYMLDGRPLRVDWDIGASLKGHARGSGRAAESPRRRIVD